MSDPCALTAEDFGALALDLLPLGTAWPREPDTVLWEFWHAVGDEVHMVHERACDLLDEFPCTATELLPDWERALGLPDPCYEPPTTIPNRRIAVCAKLALRGGQSIAYLEAALSVLGFQIVLTESFPFRASSSHVGNALSNTPWTYTINVGSGTNDPLCVFFRAGQARANDPLVDCFALGLLCLLEAISPAHTNFNIIPD